MKLPTAILLAAAVAVSHLAFGAQGAGRPDLVILDATGVRNLRIQTAMVEPAVFEETIFALGRIETKPGSVAAVSSRISGRLSALRALPGDRVQAGAEIARVESRQPGEPPPTVGLNAPISGVVSRLDVKLGDPVEPDRALLEITDLSEVMAVARVPEHLAGRLSTGATVRIVIPGLAESTLEGRLARLGVAADTASGTIDAHILLPNPEHRIRPGMRAEFSIKVAERANVVAVPREAVQGEASHRFVFVKDFNLPNAFVRSPVVTGESNDRSIEIVSGLLPADEVVTQGAYALSFVGSGTVSLKAALDAAHGHEHNADGSEMTSAQRRAAGPVAGLAVRDAALPWKIVSGVLFVLLLLVGSWRRPRAPRKGHHA